jgi:drug/metabolite transporter (DMT)-like permease
MTASSVPSPHSRAYAYAALASVCLLWGTTYLAIRISLDALPPFYLIAIRYTISGGALLLAAALFGVPVPRGRELLQTAACGVVCIGIGNGFLALAELRVPSGLAALIYTTCPFWMAGIDALLPGGKAPRAASVWGLVVGSAGVLFLVLPGVVREGIGGSSLAGFLILQVSVVGWTTGALLQKRVKARSSPLVLGAVQQLAAGLAMFVPAAIFERAPSAIALRPGLAVVYLIVFGSCVGFSSFIYAMTRLPVALVSIYTFVNPIVAVFLGWLFYREPFGRREFVAMVVIFAGVALVKRSESRHEKM